MHYLIKKCQCVKALEWSLKERQRMGRENERENDHFCKIEGCAPFFSSLLTHSEVNFSKMDEK